MRARLLLIAMPLVATIVAPPPAAALELFGYQCCFKLPTGSMKPTLFIGDLLALKLFGGDRLPQAGELVAFEHPKDKTIFIKRVIGIPGDRIQMVGGELHINGTPVKRDRIDNFVDTDDDGKKTPVKRWRETLPNGASYETLDLQDNGFLDNTRIFTVPPGSYFMLGDNRGNSSDSRSFGAIEAAKVLGRLIVLWRRR